MRGAGWGSDYFHLVQSLLHLAEFSVSSTASYHSGFLERGCSL